MNQFTIGQQHTVDLSVNVMGTSADPTVRLIIETLPEIAFPAYKVGERWVSTVFVPANLQAGTYKLRVEVVLNNRLFTPFSKPIEIIAPAVEAETIAAPVQPPEELPVPVEVTPAPAPEVVLPPAIEAIAPPVEAAPVEAAPAAPIKSLFRDEPPAVVKEEPKKITLPADFFKFTPKEVKKVEIALPPIDQALKHIKVEGISTGVKLAETRGSVPVALVKGEIVYE